MGHQSQVSPRPVEVIPDLFGYTIHLDGAKLHIPKDRLIETLGELLRWLPPYSRESKKLLSYFAAQHGIYAEDLFPEEAPTASECGNG